MSNHQSQNEKLKQNESVHPDENKGRQINRYGFLKRMAGSLFVSFFLPEVSYGFLDLKNKEKDFHKHKRRFQKKNNEHAEEYWEILPLGNIKPEGWIFEKLQFDLYEGLTGNYDQISTNVNLKLFEKQEREPGTKVTMPLRGEEKAWWAGEHEGYWKDAVVRTAFLVDAPEYKRQVYRWVKGILAAQDADGYIGIYSKKGRFPQQGFNGELWTQSRIFQVLLAHYEFTGERRVLEAVEKAVNLTLTHYQDNTYFARPRPYSAGVRHGVGFMDTLEWLYRITGKDRYKKASVWLYNDYSTSKTRFSDMALENLLEADKLWEGHTPHIMEGLHMPQICYAFTGDEKYSRAANNALTKLDLHSNPGGGIVGDERVEQRKGGGNIAGEYCSVTESIITLNRIFAYRKDFRIGDRVERSVFNHGMGARFHPTNSAARYLAYDNQMSADNPKKSSGRHVYSATTEAADCCTLNSTRLMPYYVEGMWYQSSYKDALVANLYGPSRVVTKVGGVNIEIIERTDYPFSDKIVFELKPERPVDFALILRVPEAKNNLAIDAKGGKIRHFSEYIEVTKTWKRGDEIKIDFNFEVELCTDHYGERYYQRGPLIFALQLPEVLNKGTEFKPRGKPSGFYQYLIHPENTTGWNYKIDPKAHFKLVNLPNGDMKQPWAHPPLGLKGKMIDKKGKHVEVTLVPQGSTYLRRVTFPLSDS